jgi:transcriptional regulator with XRE-family HTH domain
MGRDTMQIFFVAPGVTTVTQHLYRVPGMAEQLYRKTYIKEWREKRGLSLRRLADRLEQTPGGDLLISHTSIGRIEKGQQPYSQPILEAIAAALGVTASMLLEVNPEKDGDVIDITLRLNKAPPELRRQAIDILEALLKSAGQPGR